MTMKERPILFSGEMVRAILDGRKTQTRRVFKNPDNYACLTGDCPHGQQTECDQQLASYCKFGQPGERLWVKETHQIVDHMQTTRVIYRADGLYQDESWRPSIFMRRMDSRITLEITAVRVERLQDISEEDAKAEGIEGRWHPNDPHLWTWRDYGTPGRFAYGSMFGPVESYETLWNSINGKKHPWASNPCVRVVSFKRL